MTIIAKEPKLKDQLLQELLPKLESFFQKAPATSNHKLESIEVPPGIDAAYLLRLPLGEKRLLFKIEGFLEPRLVREVSRQLTETRKNIPDSYGVLGSISISQLSREILENDGHGYIDRAGNCLMSFGQIYIRIGDYEDLKIKKRRLRTLYSPKAERILRALTLSPANRKTWKVKELAHEANVSLGLASNVRKLLLDREWCIERDGGIALQKPKQLLEEWAMNYKPDRNKARYFYSPQSIPELETALASFCTENEIKYALTSFSSAARYSPVVTYARAVAYIAKEGLNNVVGGLQLKEAPTGANLCLLEPYDDGVFYGSGNASFDRINLVSDIQTYLDLRSSPGRGKEAADFLYDNWLGIRYKYLQ